MIILGIETSCDETAAAILEQKGNRIQILSNVVASSALLQSKYGGIIPEQAAREQIRSIIPVLKEAFEQARLKPKDINAIAVTQGPGLIGSLLVGVETAKALASVWDKPLIPVNHLLGHFYANWIFSNPNHQPPTFPAIGLLVSGGHTDLVLFKAHGKFEYLGGTRDDASGECFDKCARLLGLPYPGGPQISKLAKDGNPEAFNLPRPMADSKDFDFSFSGLKTAVSNLLKEIKTSEVRGTAVSHSVRPGFAGPYLRNKVTERASLMDLCASIEAAIIDILIQKTVTTAKKYNVEQIIVAGGVAANQKLVEDLRLKIKELRLKAKVFVPPPYLCTDNGAMIASAGFFSPRFAGETGTKAAKSPLALQANPNLSLAY